MLQLAFALGDPKNFADAAIMRVTNARETHVEILFSDVWSWSSSQWDGGVRFKRIAYSTAAKWRFVALPTVDEAKVRAWCELQVGRPYDWWGLMNMARGKFEGEPDRAMFCSDAVVQACQQDEVFFGVDSKLISPGALRLMAEAFVDGYGRRD
jgi:uncharacterized protein YycO